MIYSFNEPSKASKMDIQKTEKHNTNVESCSAFTSLKKILIAKTNPKSSAEWLPLWMHAEDTAGIMDRIARKWLSGNVRMLISKDFTENDFYKICRFLGYVHDIGKATSLFQAKIGSQLPDILAGIKSIGIQIPCVDDFTVGNKSPHALASETILLHKGCPTGIASVVGSHHGKPRPASDIEDLIEDQFVSCNRNYYGDFGRKDPNRDFLRSIWNAVWDDMINTGLEYAGYESMDDLPELSVSVQVLLTGMLIMADWIASNTLYFPLISVDDSGENELYPDRVDDAWNKINLPVPWNPLTYSIDTDRFNDLFGFAPNKVQQAFLDAIESCSQPGVFILEAQMGVGKTEAALAGAEVLSSRTGSGGIFFGLPTQATANGIFPRLEDWAEKQSEYELHAIRLAHGMAEFNEAYQSLFQGSSNFYNDEEKDHLLIVHQWFEGRKQALLSNFVIGTVDQFLLSALKQKHVMLRHLGIAGKVVIIDECHAYDAYMNVYLDRALTWMGTYKVPVIILSATLPPKRRASLIDAYLGNPTIHANDDPGWKNTTAYPLLTWTDGSQVRQSAIELQNVSRKEISISTLTDDMICSTIENALADGGCAGIIVNTVKRAQTIAQALKEEFHENDVLLLHSHFVYPDRAEKESELLKRIGKRSTPDSRNGLIVVGTQVLEQSLDIDFDFLLTDLCPMDLLVQRIGRLHRHEGRVRPGFLSTPHCCVLGASGNLDKGSKYIYKSWMLLKTRELLPERILLPGDIAPFVHLAYKDPDDEELTDDVKFNAWKEQEIFISKKQSKASGFLLTVPYTSSKYQELNSLAGLLEGDVTEQAKDSEAAVRDGSNPITVLVLMHHEDDTISLLPWQNDGMKIARDRVPAADEARKVLLQQIHLPVFLSTDQVIVALEKEAKRLVPEWQYSGWLKDELFLFLDENFQAEITTETAAYILSYDRDNGLIYSKKEGNESC